uniref:Uncharacterized protein n=1 Tax=Anguilla anguilla TaxID=7936 RepID=A0A0E9QF95_ANGAN
MGIGPESYFSFHLNTLLLHTI